MALTLYDLEMVIEPFRETTLSAKAVAGQAEVTAGAKFQWRLMEADENGDPLAGAHPTVDMLGGVLVTERVSCHVPRMGVKCG